MDKNLIFFILLILSVNIYSQKNSDKDSVKYYANLAVNSESNKRIPYINKALLFAEKTKDSKIIADILIKKAHLQYYADLTNDSFATLRLASLQDYTKKNPYFQARIKIIRSDNYQRIGLDSLCLRENKEVLKILDYKTKDVKEQSMLLRSIGRLMAYYYEHKNHSLYEKYFADYENFIKKLNKKDFIPEFESFYFNKVSLLLEKKSFDSAFYYLKEAEQFQQSLGEKTYPYYYYYLFGEYYYNIQDYKKCLDYYTMCIRKMEKNSVKDEEFFDAYLKAANASEKLGNKQQQIDYLNTYTKLKEEIKPKKDALNTEVNNLIREKERTYMSYQNKILTGTGILLFVVIILGLYISRIQKKKEALKAENEKQNSEKEKLISIIEKEKQLSRQKSKDAIEELLELVKKNDSSFYVKFQNIFPDFQNKLIDISPELTANELELLAYIFLNLNSKEIADFTFKSVRTIQNRKYALRKKLKIDTNLDFHVWLKDTVTKNKT